MRDIPLPTTPPSAVATSTTDPLHQCFRNMDDDSDFNLSAALLRNPATKSFVVRYSAKESHVAFNLGPLQWEEFLPVQVPRLLSLHNLVFLDVYPILS